MRLRTWRLAPLAAATLLTSAPPFSAPAHSAPAPGADDDLVAALECRASVDDATTIMALATNDEAYGPTRGWTRDAQSPLYRPTYTLAAPIMVFGHSATQIVFQSQTIFALLPGVTPESVAQKLEIKPDLYDGEVFMGARVVQKIDYLDPSDDSHTHYSIALQVTNFSLESHDTMAGCSYIAADPLPPKKD
jgi:hypothetical protein